MNWGERGRNVLWKKRERGDESGREGVGERKMNGEIVGQIILEGEEEKARVGKCGKKRVEKSRRGRRGVVEMQIWKWRERKVNLEEVGEKLKCREG